MRSPIEALTSWSMRPTISAMPSMVSASMIEVSGVASPRSISSWSFAITVWVIESEPALRMAIARSPGSSKTNILR